MMRTQMTPAGLLLFVLMTALLLQGSASQGMQSSVPEGSLLTHAEMAALFSQPSQAEFANSRGITMVSYLPDGTQTLKKGSFEDVGNYRIDGNQICSKWKKIRNGKEECSVLYKIGEKEYRVAYPSGREGGMLTFK